MVRSLRQATKYHTLIDIGPAINTGFVAFCIKRSSLNITVSLIDRPEVISPACARLT